MKNQGLKIYDVEGKEKVRDIGAGTGRELFFMMVLCRV